MPPPIGRTTPYSLPAAAGPSSETNTGGRSRSATPGAAHSDRMSGNRDGPVPDLPKRARKSSSLQEEFQKKHKRSKQAPSSPPSTAAQTADRPPSAASYDTLGPEVALSLPSDNKTVSGTSSSMAEAGTPSPKATPPTTESTTSATPPQQTAVSVADNPVKGAVLPSNAQLAPPIFIIPPPEDDSALNRAEFEERFTNKLLSLLDEATTTELPIATKHIFMAALLNSIHEMFLEKGHEITPDALPTELNSALNEGFDIACSVGDGLLSAKTRKGDIGAAFATHASETLRWLYRDIAGSPISTLPAKHRMHMCVDPRTLDALDAFEEGSSHNPLIALIYDTEPGYLHGMVEGWKFLSDQRGTRVSNELIVNLHRVACSETTAAKMAGFQDKEAMRFGLVSGQNLSAEGNEELTSFANEIRNANPALAEFGMCEVEGEVKLHRPSVPDGTLHAITEQWINDYNNDKAASSAESDEERALRRVVGLCQKLERLHPFIDGNCRVFGNLLLNHLLTEEGLPATILKNPNVIDGFSLNEAITEVKKGQTAYRQLLTST